MDGCEKLYIIVFGTHTKEGRQFDIVLLWLILLSIAVVMLESIPELGLAYRDYFFGLEWLFTITFSIEYLLRIFISPKPFKYIFSFWGLIDLLSVLPTFLALFIVGSHYFTVVRIFRLLRVFRILKLARFNSEAGILIQALRGSFYKISIFLLAVISTVVLLGTIMYVVEGGEKGFTSIPQSIYWAIVTVTTVGYGDMVPHTVLGKFISSIAMIIGYGIIAVPTGIVTAEIAKTSNEKIKCPSCNSENGNKAKYCNSCGDKIA